MQRWATRAPDKQRFSLPYPVCPECDNNYEGRMLCWSCLRWFCRWHFTEHPCEHVPQPKAFSK